MPATAGKPMMMVVKGQDTSRPTASGLTRFGLRLTSRDLRASGGRQPLHRRTRRHDLTFAVVGELWRIYGLGMPVLFEMVRLQSIQAQPLRLEEPLSNVTFSRWVDGGAGFSLLIEVPA